MATESQDPIALWTRLKVEHAEYQREKAMLKQKQLDQHALMRQVEEKKREYARHKANEQRFRTRFDALADQIEDLHAARDQLANGRVESGGAETRLSDEAKAAVRAALLAELKEDLVRLLFEEKTDKRVKDASQILYSDHLEWEYILTKELSFDELHDLLKKFIALKKAKVRELLQNQKELSRQLIQTDKSLGREKLKELAHMNNPCIHVNIVEYLNLLKPEEKMESSLERSLEPSKKAAIRDIFNIAWEKKPVETKKTKKDIFAEAKSYEEYLHLLDKEMFNAYMIYEKQRDVYKRMSKPDKLVLARSLK